MYGVKAISNSKLSFEASLGVLLINISTSTTDDMLLKNPALDRSLETEFSSFPSRIALKSPQNIVQGVLFFLKLKLMLEISLIMSLSTGLS